MGIKLERMKREVKKRAALSGLLAAAGAALLVVVFTQCIPMRYEDEHIKSFLMGFQIGLLLMLEAVALFRMAVCLRAAGDEKKLKSLYFKENDERVKYINQMAGKKCMNLTMLILVVAAVAVSYFSMEAFAALCAAAVVTGLVKKFVRLYYAGVFTGTEEQD